MRQDFPPCAACGAARWRSAWSGKVRAGKFGSFSEPTEIRQCEGCGVQRLAEGACKDESFYAGPDYRQLLGQGSSAASFYSEHDPLQLERLAVAEPHTIRGKTVADIGCAGGSFLDHLRGLASVAIAIEPAEQYHGALAASGQIVQTVGRQYSVEEAEMSGNRIGEFERCACGEDDLAARGAFVTKP